MRKRFTDHKLRYKNAAAGMRREIVEGYKYNPKKVKHLKHILHNVNVSLGTLVSALNEFSKVKGPDVSPDGLLGGLGYIMPIREMKQNMNEMIHKLSDVADSLADELTNPNWNIKEDSEIKELIEEKEKVDDRIEEDLVPEDIVNDPDFEGEKPKDDNQDEDIGEEDTQSDNINDTENPMDDGLEDNSGEEKMARMAQKSEAAFYSNIKAALIRFYKPGINK